LVQSILPFHATAHAFALTSADRLAAAHLHHSLLPCFSTTLSSAAVSHLYHQLESLLNLILSGILCLYIFLVQVVWRSTCPRARDYANTAVLKLDSDVSVSPRSGSPLCGVVKLCTRHSDHDYNLPPRVLLRPDYRPLDRAFPSTRNDHCYTTWSNSIKHALLRFTSANPDSIPSRIF
jgi:hypothetical protein